MRNLILMFLAGIASIFSFHDAVESAIRGEFPLAVVLSVVYTVTLCSLVYLAIDAGVRYIKEDDEDD